MLSRLRKRGPMTARDVANYSHMSTSEAKHILQSLTTQGAVSITETNRTVVYTVKPLSATGPGRSEERPEVAPVPPPVMPKLPAMTDLDTLISRILAIQEQRTPQWVRRSRALQALFARLDRALEGDDATLRAEVEAVTADLANLIPWSDQ